MCWSRRHTQRAHSLFHGGLTLWKRIPREDEELLLPLIHAFNEIVPKPSSVPHSDAVSATRFWDGMPRNRRARCPTCNGIPMPSRTLGHSVGGWKACSLRTRSQPTRQDLQRGEDGVAARVCTAREYAQQGRRPGSTRGASRPTPAPGERRPPRQVRHGRYASGTIRSVLRARKKH